MFANDLIKYFLVLTRTRVFQVLFVTRAQMRFLFHTLTHTHTDSFQVFLFVNSSGTKSEFEVQEWAEFSLRKTQDLHISLESKGHESYYSKNPPKQPHCVDVTTLSLLSLPKKHHW